jgi:hypothetical protein
MSMSEPDQKVCAHGLCNCLADADSDYCSPYCSQVGLRTNNTVDDNQIVVCDCGHPTCIG